jgi:ComF family protein
LDLTKKLIRQFKYQPYLKDLAKTLASIVAEHLLISGKNTEVIWQNSVLVPIPLDNKKLRNRGYNQSEELAKEMAKILKVPVISDVLIKIKPTKAQAESTKQAREKNLEGAFTVKNPSAIRPEGHPGKIFLVDDVYTTGSTMEECSKILKQAGAKEVWGITIAREG